MNNVNEMSLSKSLKKRPTKNTSQQVTSTYLRTSLHIIRISAFFNGIKIRISYIFVICLRNSLLHKEHVKMITFWRTSSSIMIVT
jgi:hypothetical protein